MHNNVKGCGAVFSGLPDGTEASHLRSGSSSEKKKEDYTRKLKTEMKKGSSTNFLIIFGWEKIHVNLITKKPRLGSLVATGTRLKLGKVRAVKLHFSKVSC